MKLPIKITHIVPLKHVDTHDRWIVVPKAPPGNRRTTLRGLKFKRGNCYFDSAVPKGLIDFVFRAVVHLGIQKRPLTVVRGTVKRQGHTVHRTVSVKELPWGSGTLIVIPRRLRYRDCMVLQVDGRKYEIRIMENIVLQAVLRLARPEMGKEWYPSAAAVVLAIGWKHLNNEITHDIFRVPTGHTGTP